MKRTSAEDAIIQALCPGPGEESAFGVPFVTYASRSATRAARSGAPPAPTAAPLGGEPVSANAGEQHQMMTPTNAATDRTPTRIRRIRRRGDASFGLMLVCLVV